MKREAKLEGEGLLKIDFPSYKPEVPHFETKNKNIANLLSYMQRFG